MSSTKKDTRTRILTATWQLMEQRRGQDVHMRNIAEAAGISRQAIYLHFASRTELITATINYVDEIKGLDERLDQIKTAKTAIGVLEASVEVWGNYIPEIYGLAKAMLMTRDTDEDMAAAWNESMGCLRDACQATMEALSHESILVSEWTVNKAVDALFMMLSINNWEQLTIECGWSQSAYIEWMKTISKRTFVEIT